MDPLQPGETVRRQTLSGVLNRTPPLGARLEQLEGINMAYLVPSEFVTKMVDAGEAKIFMSTRDTVIRAFMAGAILALAAAFAITINVQTGSRWPAPSCFRSASACCTCWASTC